MTQVQSRNDWLDACRALAVLLVVFCHGTMFFPGEIYRALQWVAGYFGVEIFFCLSGLLIGTIVIDTVRGYDGAPGKLGVFMLRRWFRTLPNYYFYLCVNIAIFYFGWAFADKIEIGRFLIFTQALLSPPPGFFPESWSLAIEEVFYFLLPISFFLVWLICRRWLAALVVTLVVLLSVSMGLRYHAALHAIHWDDQIRKVTLLRIDSLMWGVLLALMRSHVLVDRPRALKALGCALLCFLPVALYVDAQGIAWLDSSFFAKFWLFPITSLGICGALTLGMGIRTPSLMRPLVAAIARWSYSMYLSNLTALHIVLHFFQGGSNLPGRLLRAAVYLVLVFCFSIFTYLVIEKPALRLRDRLVPAAPKQPASSLEPRGEYAASAWGEVIDR